MYQYPKSFLTTHQLIQKLTDAGMIITSQEEAEKALMTIGYYRLKGYSFQYFDRASQKYITGTQLSDILRLYQFDMELSHLVFGYLSQIEVALRTRLIHAFEITQDPLALNDPSMWQDKKLYWQNQGVIASEITRSHDAFIKHNFDNHDGSVPIWASVEIMSFGTLSKVIKNLKTGNQSVFSIIVQDYKFRNKNGQNILPSKK